ncbi:glycosyltransferase family 2 protein [Vibrio breoganii]
MLSVIIPLYNKASFIKETLNSVVNQSFPDYEVIIYDDGSTDNSVRIVENFINEYDLCHKVRVFKHSNKGVSYARNMAVEYAEFDYCVFLDADDLIIDRDYFLDISNVINKFNCDVIAYGFSPRKKRIPSKYDQTFIDYFELYVKYGAPFCSSSIVVKKDKCTDLFPVGETMGEDIYAWVSLINSNNKIFFRNVSAVRYVVDSEGAMNRQKKPLKLIVDRDSFNIDSPYFDSFIKHHEIDYIRSCIYHGDRVSLNSFLSEKPKSSFVFYRFLQLFPFKSLNWIKKKINKVTL